MRVLAGNGPVSPAGGGREAIKAGRRDLQGKRGRVT